MLIKLLNLGLAYLTACVFVLSCANKQVLEKKNLTSENSQKEPGAKVNNGKTTATIEIVHPAAIQGALSAYNKSTVNISFDLMSSVKLLADENVSKLKSSVTDNFGISKVTVIENITPGVYSHLLMWVDFLNESAFYSGVSEGQGIELKAGEVLRLEPNFMVAADAMCPGEDESLHRLSFYPKNLSTNCKLPPIDEKNPACIAMKEQSFSCMLPDQIVRCVLQTTSFVYEVKASTNVCSDIRQALMKKMCFDNANLSSEDIANVKCQPVAQ